MGKKLTISSVKERLYKLNKDLQIQNNEYIGCKELLICKCDICNYEWDIAWDKLSIRAYCPQCMGYIKTTNNFKKEIFNLVENEYTVLGEYINAKTKIKIIHNLCNHEYPVEPNSFLQGSRCPKCFGTFKKDTEIFKEEVKNLVGEEYTVLGDYIGANEKILMKHNFEGCKNYKWSIGAHSFLQGHRCPKCAKVYKKTTEDFKEEVYNLVGDEYTVLGQYTTAKVKVDMKHNICNRIYGAIPDKFIHDRRCPFCHESEGEKSVRCFLETNHIYFDSQFIFDDLFGVGGNPLKYDFVVFKDIKQTVIKCLIEYDGQYHFKPIKKYTDEPIELAEERFRIQKIHDRLKNEYCEINNIELIRIKYTNFNNINTILHKELLNFEI